MLAPFPEECLPLYSLRSVDYDYWSEKGGERHRNGRPDASPASQACVGIIFQHSPPPSFCARQVVTIHVGMHCTKQRLVGFRGQSSDLAMLVPFPRRPSLTSRQSRP